MRPAPDPRYINWENLSETVCSQFWRKSLTILIIFFVWSLVFLCLVWTRVANENMPNLEKCRQFSGVKADTLNPRNTNAMNCFCASSSTISYLNDSIVKDVCSAYLTKALNYHFSKIVSAIAIAVFNKIMFFYL